MTAEQLFRAKAPGIMAQLIRDFPIEVQAAAAIVGNLGHESLGFTAMQELTTQKSGLGSATATGTKAIVDVRQSTATKATFAIMSSPS